MIRADIPQGNGSAAWVTEHHGNRQAARKPNEADPGRGGIYLRLPALRHFSEFMHLGSAEDKAIHSTLTAPSKSWLLRQGAPASSLEDPALGSILQSRIKTLLI